ncbi:ammonium transporter [Mycoemilia scoparia]|uniref:Ammonium transporter n=1 Tax=Mycoemilia scoparia TaxID=417184 RepID=A0A9W7ZZ28_9FUNG|nr:ammonium transporter [Mycoemilia scoparia]
MLGKRQTSTDPIPGLDTGDTAWVLASTALVFIMIPGLGYFYSGMVRSKNAVSLVLLCSLSMSIIAFQWVFWGYSLAFSKTATSSVIGNVRYFLLLHINDTTHPNAPTIPETLFAMFQGLFAALTGALTIGAAAERVRFMPTLVYFFIWTTLVYCPIAYWTWSANGFLSKLGVYDFAGGTPVEICSGFSALAYALVLGKRHGFGEESFEPHNYLNIQLGAALLWFGWFGFNSGSVVAANGRAGVAIFDTHIAGALAGLSWALVAYIRYGRKFSSFHFCSGAVSGMVAITPAAGFVAPWAALVFGAVAGVVCHFAVELKEKFGFDDALDVFAVHGVGGMVGMLLTGIFADKKIAILSGQVIGGGWINGRWKQLPIQMAAIAAGALWSLIISFLILYIMNLIPFLEMRVHHEAEATGLDLAEMGEAGYNYAPNPNQPPSTLLSYNFEPTPKDSDTNSNTRRSNSEPQQDPSPSLDGLQMNFNEKAPRPDTGPSEPPNQMDDEQKMSKAQPEINEKP